MAALATVALSLCPVAWPGLEVDSLMRVNEEPLEPELRLQDSSPAGARGQGWGLPKGPLGLHLGSEPRLWSASPLLPLKLASSSHSTPALRHTKCSQPKSPPLHSQRGGLTKREGKLSPPTLRVTLQ